MLAPAGKGGRGDLMYSFFFVFFCFSLLIMLAPAGKGGRGDLIMYSFFFVFFLFRFIAHVNPRRQRWQG